MVSLTWFGLACVGLAAFVYRDACLKAVKSTPLWVKARTIFVDRLYDIFLSSLKLEEARMMNWGHTEELPAWPYPNKLRDTVHADGLIVERNSSNLYSRLFAKSGMDLTKLRTVTELCSGRGGGLAVLRLKLAEIGNAECVITGLDLNNSQIVACQKYWNSFFEGTKGAQLNWLQHNAMDPMPVDEPQDLIINLEASHNYTKDRMHVFEHTFRALRPGGVFMFSDFGKMSEWKALEKWLKARDDVEITYFEDITPKVVESKAEAAEIRKNREQKAKGLQSYVAYFIMNGNLHKLKSKDCPDGLSYVIFGIRKKAAGSS